MGKLGGREPNYHSDLDVIFLYEADGATQPSTGKRSDRTTTNQHFFSQLAQRIIKAINQLGPYGRLYELDPRLRPTGKSGSLAVSFDGLAQYFASGQGQLWERQALCKARPICGSTGASIAAMRIVHNAITGPGWKASDAAEIRRMRARLEQTASKRNLKRGPGGTVDIEFSVQMLQLKHASDSPSVLVPGTFDAIDQLEETGHLKSDDAEYLRESYRFLRSIEARLRLMNTAARHELPVDEMELKKLALLLEYEGAESLMKDCDRYASENRRRFQRLFDQM
jgi:glutamate-ammonia-ligase adenylyltransferase